MRLACLSFLACLFVLNVSAQLASIEENIDTRSVTDLNKDSRARSFFGIASFYADKFNGRQTATGDTYSHTKFTAACNILALGTWIRVANLRNNKSVIVQINDRLHPKNKRIVDLSKVAAEKLGYINRGLTQVKLEVLGRKKPSS